ncbi:MAG: pyridoxamine 5'-phosphate oxidase family protein [Anaerolineales bacterium]|nr:pyridoxamine 5'-phosphate oxidase family protein [Anaerolineales bacterium]
MPKNYDPAVTPPNAQRRPKNARDDAWVRAFLERAEIGHVATGWGDQPFLTPTTFWYDAAGHQIAFHSNVVGRVRANAEQQDRVCFETSTFGRFLPSNIAIEFSVQYASVVVFGRVRVVAEPDEQRRLLTGLLGKYFPSLTAGREYRPITEPELKRTSVYAIAIESWSGKENWAERADQSDAWPPLPEDML